MSDFEENPRFQPHVLIIMGDTADEREYEIQHPAACPKVCYWAPGVASEHDRTRIATAFEVPGIFLADAGHLDCYVAYEISGVGLDGLDLGPDPPDDGTYTPASQWSMDGWRRLPPGRYAIEAWFRHGAGLMPWGESESEGGLNLIGLEAAN